MRRFLFLSLIAAAACVRTMPREHRPPPIGAQSWVGGLDLGGDWQPIQLQLDLGARPPSGTLDFPTVRDPAYHGIRLSNVQYGSSGLHFEWKDEDGPASIDARVPGTHISGTFQQASTSARVHLARGFIGAADATARFGGLYEVEPGHRIWIGPVSELSRQFGFVDERSGRSGVLYSRGPSTFFSGITSMIPYPAEILARFASSDSGAMALAWRQGGQALRAARSRSYTTEDVTFRNRNVTLSGTLVLPVRPGPHPAMVFIHGASAQLRTYFSALPYLLADAGIASLVYDKRGVGKSTGNRRTSTMADFADDAIAGARYLKSRRDIVADRIGVYGHSQGGWQAPLAVSRAPGVFSFLVIAAGPAKDYESQTNDEITNSMRFAGMSETDIAQTMQHQRLYWRVIRRQASWAELAASTARARKNSWGRFAWKPDSEARVLSDTLEYIDPKPILEHLRIPVLALYGENDIRVNGRENAELMRAALTRAGNPDFTIRLVARADHDFWEAAVKTPRDVAHTRGYARGYLGGLLSWITAHSGPGQPAD